MIRRTVLAFFALVLFSSPAMARDFFWEAPEVVSTRDSRFPSSSSNGKVSAIVWQDIEPDGKDSGSIWLSGRIFDGTRWLERERFAGPFAYAGEVPSIASVTVNGKGRIIVPVASGVNSVTVYSSDDLGSSFASTVIDGGGTGLLAPRVFVRSDGGYLLFATYGTENNFVMVMSRSDDGVAWPALTAFGPTSSRRRAFLPSHTASNGQDIVVFQAFHDDAGRSSYQLYSTVSRDRGRSWSSPALITNFVDPGAPASVIHTGYHNQRAKMLVVKGAISLVWERARTTNEKYAIYHATVGADGKINGPVERISSDEGYCYDPDIIELSGSPAVTWFDNRRGINRVYLARKEGLLWSEDDLSKSAVDSFFARLLPVDDTFETYWQQSLGKGQYRIVRLAPDRTVPVPVILPIGFASGEASRAEIVRFALKLPEDSSGTAGYSLAWGRGSRPNVPKLVQYLPSETRVTQSAEDDGSWFLGVRLSDYAGNWSDPVYVEYVKDTTPPAPPVVVAKESDPKGYLESNTFSLKWAPSESDTIAGYAWNLELVAPLAELRASADASGRVDPAEAARGFTPTPPAPVIRSKEPVATFENQDNGLYALTVAAVDSVGNVGEPTVSFIALDKYKPVTKIDAVDLRKDETGALTVSIVGRGFTEGGLIGEIHIDRDGVAPWDLTLTRSSGRFRVVNDRLITGLVIDDLDEGSYRVVLSHPARGIYASKITLAVSESGTVKLGDYRYEFTPPWERATGARRSLVDAGRIFMLSMLLFAILVLIVSARGVSLAARDTLIVRDEVRALLTGDIMPSERKRRAVALKRKGVGLRFKLAFFTTTLVISVVLIVSIPLGVRFSANQERTLARGLESRVNVLLESLSSGARAYLPSQNLLELGFLPSQMSALDEATYATITGTAAGSSLAGIDFVWASNDPDLAVKIDTERLEPGRSALSGEENAEIDSRVAVLNSEAEQAVGELSRGIVALTQEGRSLALSVDSESVRRRDEIQVITRQLEERLAAELSRLSAQGTGSWPAYESDALSRENTRYVFFKPVLYRSGSSSNYVNGTVRVGVSTESLLAAMDQDRRALVQTTAYIALFAVLMGVIGALILASIIISPVRKLAAHVAMIRDTEDKEDLDGKEIALRSQDEIGLLGETINDMTRGLVRAAAASKDLTVGKEVQKMFIPLETNADGRKLSSGSTSDDHAEFFGYYEGAKGVSGDYFDYIKLDDRHYAIIKCDVAGKGVPAALIMVEVATLFLDYFKDWKYEKNGYKLGYIVSRINDLIESRGFKGRFAAFTLCIFDSASGAVHFCNAGDNLIHMYCAAERRMKVVTLKESSAAGVFPTFMVDMKGGFAVESLKLAAGDVLFLYTDGIEEAKRLFRRPDLQVLTCAEPGLAPEAAHGNHSVGQDNEELGPERVNAIIEAVFAHSSFTLEKWHNPEGAVRYEFDFSSCEGTLEEAILALVSVEKVFRMYADSAATDFSRVQVDRKIDVFLSRHFRQYGLYCSSKRDHPELGEYLYYTRVREDDQYDDLTILAVRKKGK